MRCFCLRRGRGMRWLCKRRGWGMRWLCKRRGRGMRWLCKRRGRGMRWLCKRRGRGFEKAVCVQHEFLSGDCETLPHGENAGTHHQESGVAGMVAAFLREWEVQEDCFESHLNPRTLGGQKHLNHRPLKNESHGKSI